MKPKEPKIEHPDKKHIDEKKKAEEDNTLLIKQQKEKWATYTKDPIDYNIFPKTAVELEKIIQFF
tara:strand:+ start:226 stop:420 length:195 start_codon:yes stop_codon:yes gene_type:complete